MAEENNIIIKRTERANSYEFGKAQNRFKLYFDDPKELKVLIEELNSMGLIQNEA